MTAERSAIYPNLDFESALWKSGYQRLAGLDEAGRGAWAGPVCAAAVILPPNPTLLASLHHVRDSKLMTPLQRAVWAPRIIAEATSWGVGFASSAEIDSLGIVPATLLAATRALQGLEPDFLLTDFLLLRQHDIPQCALVKGDQRSLSVASASVLAKTARDAHMLSLDLQYPLYGFARHKGYGTRLHQQSLDRFGVCPEHRHTFALFNRRHAQ